MLIKMSFGFSYCALGGRSDGSEVVSSASAGVGLRGGHLIERLLDWGDC